MSECPCTHAPCGRAPDVRQSAARRTAHVYTAARRGAWACARPRAGPGLEGRVVEVRVGEALDLGDDAGDGHEEGEVVAGVGGVEDGLHPPPFRPSGPPNPTPSSAAPRHAMPCHATPLPLADRAAARPKEPHDSARLGRLSQGGVGRSPGAIAAAGPWGGASGSSGGCGRPGPGRQRRGRS